MPPAMCQAWGWPQVCTSKQDRPPRLQPPVVRLQAQGWGVAGPARMARSILAQEAQPAVPHVCLFTPRASASSSLKQKRSHSPAGL